jgi:hypothetical protein
MSIRMMSLRWRAVMVAVARGISAAGCDRAGTSKLASERNDPEATRSLASLPEH